MFRQTSPLNKTRYDESHGRRQRMVEEQLRPRGIRDERVMRAMATVPREQFVDADNRPRAYDDMALPIGHGQTISQPYTVAYMCEALRLDGHEKVLEVGTGSGYGAAVLSKLAKQVFTVERIEALAETARQRLQRLGYDNVVVCVTNGSLGLSDEAPFDGIVVTAAAESLPPPYAEQLAEGGRIVIPIGTPDWGQDLCRFTRRDDELTVENLGEFRFVPLIGEHGW